MFQEQAMGQAHDPWDRFSSVCTEVVTGNLPWEQLRSLDTPTENKRLGPSPTVER